MTSAVVSTLTYLGLVLLVAGGATRSAVIAAIGALLAGSGAWWPWPLARRTSGSRLDAFVPEFQFSERHARRMRAEPDAVYRATRAVTAGEIRFFRMLTTIRSPRLPGRTRRESILQPTWDQPILDVATRSGFLWLADAPPSEIVVGMVVAGSRDCTSDTFAAHARQGVAKAAMNFRIEDEGSGRVRVTTETRVIAVGTRARRAFGLYWAFIYPGSSLIRYGWLAAIRRRAEAGGR